MPIGASGSCDQAPTRAPIDGYIPADRVDVSRSNVERQNADGYGSQRVPDPGLVGSRPTPRTSCLATPIRVIGVGPSHHQIMGLLDLLAWWPYSASVGWRHL
jgi:hypothetical protein